MTGDGAPDEQVPLEQSAPEVIEHREAFRALAARARNVADACTKRDAEKQKPAIRGKVLIWDDATDDISAAHPKLAADLRAPDATGEVTVFLITRQQEAATGRHYWRQGNNNDKAIPAYRVDSEICVIAMPQRTPLGRFTVHGAGPTYMVQLEKGQQKVVGNWTTSVQKWVESCPRAATSAPAEPGRKPGILIINGN
jgi:hypothetical protein